MPDMETSDSRNAYLAVLQVHELLGAEFNALFREHGLSSPQFNVLRILIRGPREGVPCSVLKSELLQRVPDVTRLVDRMLKRGWVTRQRKEGDRRVVLVQLTPAGRRLCRSLYAPIDALHTAQFAHMPAKAIRQLDALLRLALRRPGEEEA